MAGDDRRRPFVSGLSLHPGEHVMASKSEVAAHACEHFFWDWDLKNGLQPILSIESWTKLSHMRLRKKKKLGGCRGRKGRK